MLTQVELSVKLLFDFALMCEMYHFTNFANGNSQIFQLVVVVVCYVAPNDNENV